MAKRQPKFDIDKWNKEYGEATAEVTKLEGVLDNTRVKLERARDYVNLLESTKRFILDGPAKPSPSSAKKSPGRKVKTQVPSIPQALPLRPSYPEMIAAVADYHRGPADIIRDRIEDKYSEDARDNGFSIPDMDEIQAFLLRWNEHPELSPANLSVGMCMSVKYKGRIGVCKKKDPYKKPSSQMYLRWIIKYCRKHNHTAPERAVLRSKLYRLLGDEFPGLKSRTGGVNGTVGSLLTRVKEGTLNASPIQQFQPSGKGGSVYLWVTTKVGEK